MSARWGGLSLALLGLAGCANPPAAVSDAARQPAIVAQRFEGASSGALAAAQTASAPGAGLQDPKAAEAPDLNWDRVFTDARLQALIRLALQHNRDLRVAALNVEQARAQAAIREADLWPTVNAGVSGSRVPTNTGGVSTTVIGGLSTTAYEVDLFGRVRQQSRAAQEQWRASVYLQSAARSSLIAAVAAAYVNVRADEALLRITQETVRSREEGLAVVQGRIKAGAGSALDEAQAQGLLQSARAALAQVQRQKALDESTLTVLVGTPLPTETAANTGTVTAPEDSRTDAPGSRAGDWPGLLATPVPPLRTGLPSEVLTRRPDIRAAEAQLLASQANLDAARRALFPRITLTASFGQASRELSSLFAGGTWVWGVAPQLLAPIFDAGRLKAGVAQADAAQQAALAQYEKALQVAFKEVHDALAASATLAQQVQALDAQVQAESRRLDLAHTRWRLGASAYLEVLDAQRSLYTAQTTLIQTQAQWLNSRGTLYKVLGGGAPAVEPSRP